jgi:hypothetical protein
MLSPAFVQTAVTPAGFENSLFHAVAVSPSGDVVALSHSILATVPFDGGQGTSINLPFVSLGYATAGMRYNPDGTLHFAQYNFYGPGDVRKQVGDAFPTFVTLDANQGFARSLAISGTGDVFVTGTFGNIINPGWLRIFDYSGTTLLNMLTDNSPVDSSFDSAQVPHFATLDGRIFKISDNGSVDAVTNVPRDLGVFIVESFAIGPADTLFVGVRFGRQFDVGNAILRVAPGSPMKVLAAGDVPLDMVFGPDGNLYVGTDNKVVMISGDFTADFPDVDLTPELTDPTYRIIRLGLPGYEHTRNDLYELSSASELNNAGQVRGFSPRFNGGSTNLGESAWFYDGRKTINIGLTGAEHTSIGGSKISFSTKLNEAGQVSGYSKRYNGGSVDLGRTAWVYNGTSTIDVGLTGSEHTRDDGYKYSSIGQLNEAGQVHGYANRYNGGSADLGRSAWFYNNATTIDIGLTDSEHTRNDGYKYSDVNELNEAGQVTGRSERYNGDTWLGHSAWLYNGATTIDIGLISSEHTRNDGFKASTTQQLNEAGQVTGRSNRYEAGSDLGRSAWLYNGATTIDIGLTGNEYTRNDGYKDSFANQLNEAGQVNGVSVRYNGGSTKVGQSVWFYDGATTIDIGLTDTEHTRNDGYQYSDYGQLNEAGQSRGQSYRYNGGGIFLGYTVWFYDGANTINIGLTGSEHTRNDGFKLSDAQKISNAGQVIGHSARYSGGNASLGESAWLYDGTTTIEIGLTGAEYTGDNGRRSSRPVYLNETGQVAGSSARYNGSASLGQDAWFYDAVLDETFRLQLSVRSDGYANSQAHYLGDDGLVLGSYTLFDESDREIGERAFYFTVAQGLHDLGSLVDGGLTAHDWEWLADAHHTNGLGQIVGGGKLLSQSDGQTAYLLTPIPEPTNRSMLLFAIALVYAGRARQGHSLNRC